MIRPCDCKGFDLWYDNDSRVCTCGHHENDHLDSRLSCLMDVWTSWPTREAVTDRPITATP